MIVKVIVEFLCDVENPESAKSYVTDVLRRRLKRENYIVGYTIQSHTEVLEV
jgi:hypothetical protein